jgi:uncharacterized membrane protein YeaQ/YmgE (transglycosylase-associated protein family)
LISNALRTKTASAATRARKRERTEIFRSEADLAKVHSLVIWIRRAEIKAVHGEEKDAATGGHQNWNKLRNREHAAAFPVRTAATEVRTMEQAGIGWIAAIIIGGIAGWLAEKFMKSNMGVFMNIILGIVGAIIANAILGVFGIVLGGWIGYLIAGFIGACILIAVARMFRR